jgi:hypothetical protein
MIPVEELTPIQGSSPRMGESSSYFVIQTDGKIKGRALAKLPDAELEQEANRRFEAFKIELDACAYDETRAQTRIHQCFNNVRYNLEQARSAANSEEKRKHCMRAIW